MPTKHNTDRTDTPPDAPSRDEITVAIEQLAEAWRDAKRAAGLTSKCTWSAVSTRLSLNRGTSQRLVRMANTQSAADLNLEYVPGVSAWNNVLRSLGETIGTSHDAYVRLESSCSAFASILAHFGGSKAAMSRSLRPDDDDELDSVFIDDRDASKKAWLDAAASFIGYRVDRRIELSFVRQSPIDRERLDFALVVVSLGCIGRSGALPFTMARYASQQNDREVAADSLPQFGLLESVTTQPVPTLVTSSDHTRQTVFLEPSWTETRKPIDIGVMIASPDAGPAPWRTDPKMLILTTLMRQPTNAFQHECYIDPALAASVTSASYHAYRDVSSMGGAQHWFDRLPGVTPIEEGRSFRSAETAHGLHARGGAFFDEIEARLGWDLASFTGFGATTHHPIPLSRYSIELECRDPG